MPIVIQPAGAPVRRSPLTLLVFSVLVGLPLAGLIGALMPELAGGFVAAWAIAAVASGAILGVIMALMYRTLAVDLDRGVVRLGSGELPLSSVTAVKRSISSGGTAQYLHYRIAADTGASVRVLVFGRPFKGLALEQAVALRGLVERSGLPASASGASAESELLSGDSQANVAAAAIGRDALLLELDGVIRLLGGADPSQATPAAAVPEGAPAPASEATESGLAPEDEQRLRALVEALATDDDGAAQLIAAAPRTAANVAAAAAAAMWLAVAGFAVAFVWGITESGGFGGGALALLGWSAAIGAVALFVWAAAADRRTLRLQALGAEWLAADPRRAERGLPAPFLGVALDAANRLLGLCAYAGSVLGFLGVMLGIGMLATGDEPDLVVFAVVLLVVGAIALVLGIWAFVATHRRRKRAAAAFAALAGKRGELAYGRF
ncbi:hypothetical protein [Agromyces terreus]|uniref:hypothetical protein n=1 Tax=Agromyces terreus TaxID=424795 RepID=UPI0031DD82ED